MGCDIHMYVEYRSKDIRKQSIGWKHFGERINPGRNYWLFGLLARVRCEFPESLTPRGLPNDCDHVVKNDNLIYISEDGGGDNECTLKQAQTWERYGSKIILWNDEPTWVENPDWHSHSWITVEEFQKVLDIYNSKDGRSIEPEYEALLSAMKRLAEFEYDVRVIFWFDN